MWVSRKKWQNLEKRLSVLEKAEQGRRNKERYEKLHGDDPVDKARELLRGR